MWTLLRKIVAFHFGYQGQVEDRDENDKPIMKDKYIESHFDFKLKWQYQWRGKRKAKVILLTLCIVMS